jgi:hypothetical protein
MMAADVPWTLCVSSAMPLYTSLSRDAQKPWTCAWTQVSKTVTEHRTQRTLILSLAVRGRSVCRLRRCKPTHPGLRQRGGPVSWYADRLGVG